MIGSRIFRIREEKAKPHHSKFCEIVVIEKDKTLDLVYEGESAEMAMDADYNMIKSQFLTYGYKAAKELMEYRAHFPTYRKAKVKLVENDKTIAQTNPIMIITKEEANLGD